MGLADSLEDGSFGSVHVVIREGKSSNTSVERWTIGLANDAYSQHEAHVTIEHGSGEEWVSRTAAGPLLDVIREIGIISELLAFLPDTKYSTFEIVDTKASQDGN